MSWYHPDPEVFSASASSLLGKPDFYETPSLWSTFTDSQLGQSTPMVIKWPQYVVNPFHTIRLQPASPSQELFLLARGPGLFLSGEDA